MALRQTLGISLALLMASAGAIAKTPERNSAQTPCPLPGAKPGKAANRCAQVEQCPTARVGWPARHAGRAGATVGYRAATPRPQRIAIKPAGKLEFGKASWYGLVGNRTASGEVLDKITATAAHRALPLGSCARVTDLDNGRSIIVKINDRGPFRPRFIIDLSPLAAQELGMRQEGVAAVAVEPVVYRPSMTDAASSAVYAASTDDPDR